MKNTVFLKQNILFFTTSSIVGFFNYLYYPLLGRFLPPVFFGEVQILLTLLFQLSIFFDVLSLVVIHIVNNHRNEKLQNQILLDLEKSAIILGGFVSILGLIFNPFLKDFFQFYSVAPLNLLSITILFSIILNFRIGFLKAKLKFSNVSIANLFLAVTKLVFSIIFVLLGLKTAGTILGIALSQILTFFYIGFVAHRLGFRLPNKINFKLPDLKAISAPLNFGLYALIATLLLSLQSSIDTIIVKHFFDAKTAGLYAGIAVIAKIIFFLTIPFSQVMTSFIRAQKDPTKNRRIFLKTGLLLITIGSLILLTQLFYPKQIISIIVGQEFFVYSHLLPKLGITQFLISLINLIVLYCLFLKYNKVILPITLGSITTITLLTTDTNDLSSIVQNLFTGSMLMLGFVITWLLLPKLKKVLGQQLPA